MEAVKEKGVFETSKEVFGVEEKACSFKTAQYRCNCSREYLKGVLVSLGEDEFRNIVKEDGAVRVHCHYCNSDYTFDETDANEIFKNK